jgi:hypothetical protein
MSGQCDRDEREHDQNNDALFLFGQNKHAEGSFHGLA